MLRKCCCLILLIVASTSLNATEPHAEPEPNAKPNAKPKLVADGFHFEASDWPWWRGPLRNGTALADQTPPLNFGASQNVLWKAAIPGRGHGSATVFGSQVFLVTCDEETKSQSLLCFDRGTGTQLWNKLVHASGGMWKNSKSSAASMTPACDGQRVFVNFPNNGALVTTALDLDGNQVWQTRVSDYVVHQGYGASPALYQNVVIVTSDNKSGGAVMALDRVTGEVVWKRDRPEKPNYSSPIIVHAAGRDQVILTGCDAVVSYAPLTGETLWETPGATTECVTSTVTDGQLIYTSGGYPKNHVSAVSADGSAKLAWENTSRVYVPSLLIRDEFLYAVLDEGIAICWRADSGEEMWKARLGGTFSSSPVLVGDQIFASNEAGDFFVFKAQPSKFEQVAKNKLGSEVFATPTICGSQIFHRVALLDESGGRQEFLFCLASESK
ncbi:MAG: PQQ-binding-like beta-propeller repeat protein [Rubripirellula sp.]